MQTEDVLNVLERLEAVGVSVWLDGGWGVDALVGSQTRPHSDLDLALDVEDLGPARRALESKGFSHDCYASPGLPARLVMVSGDGRQVDLHPLRFDAEGNGWQQLSQDGSSWGRYGAQHLRARGVVGGRVVRCLSAELQVRFHQDYELSDVDRHDLDLLATLVTH